MTEGAPLRLILLTALPLMLGGVFQQMYTLVDASVVGRGIGMPALAALGASDWFNWMFISIAQGFTHGFSIPVSQAFGARDYEDLRKNVGGAISLSAVIALAVTLLAQLAIRPVLALLGTPEEIRPMSVAYLTILFSGLPVVMAYNLLAGFLRALGDSQSPLIAMVIASLTNIALDVLFVMGFHWGVASAAAATLIAQAVSCAYCLARLVRLDFLRLRRGDLRLSRARCGRLMRLGLPVSLQNCIIAVGGMVLQRVVNPMGVAFIAGYTATNKLYGLLEGAGISYGYAMTTYAGQNLGAGRFDRIRRGLRTGAITGVVTALCITAVVFAFGRQFVSLFIEPSPQADRAVAIALEYLRIMAACLPILYLLHIYRSALQGVGNTVSPMISGVVEFVMRTGSAMLLPAVIGHTGVFWAEVLAWSGADVVLLPAWYRTLNRLERRKTAP